MTKLGIKHSIVVSRMDKSIYVMVKDLFVHAQILSKDDITNILGNYSNLVFQYNALINVLSFE